MNCGSSGCSANRGPEIHTVGVHEAGPPDTVDYFRGLTIHSHGNRGVDLLERVSWKQLAGVQAGNRRSRPTALTIKTSPAFAGFAAVTGEKSA